MSQYSQPSVPVMGQGLLPGPSRIAKSKDVQVPYVKSVMQYSLLYPWFLHPGIRRANSIIILPKMYAKIVSDIGKSLAINIPPEEVSQRGK